MTFLTRWKKYCEALYDKLEQLGDRKFSREERDRINTKLVTILSYTPRIGFFGKTGVGKSSLCNALFGEDMCPINDIQACTREPKEIFLEVEGNKGLKLVDVPGVGESSERDSEYAQLYQKLLPELDVLLWVLKADDRAFSTDEAFYKELVKPHIDQGKLLFFVLNQADKVEPYREWDEERSMPGPRQSQNINLKTDYVRQIFELKRHQVIPVSANEKYGLIDLIEAVVDYLPKEQKITFAEHVKPENISAKTQTNVKESFMDIVGDNLGEILEGPIDFVRDNICEPISDLWDSVTSSCFISTAVCEKLGKPDDCYELVQFRKFRDDWLSNHAEGEKLIQQYYQLAPQILEAIRKRSDYEDILDNLNDEYLSPCLKMIEHKQLEQCKKLYITMVNQLAEDFLKKRNK